MNKITISLLNEIHAQLNEAIRTLKNNGAMPAVQWSPNEAALRILNDAVRFERFFFVTDIFSQSVRLSKGIAQWLGYSEEEFNLNLYVSIIHEHHVKAFILFFRAITDRLKSPQSTIDFTKEKYIAELALRHASGHYLLVKQTTTFWDYDTKRQLPMAFLNEFMIWKPYEATDATGINLRMTDYFGLRLRNSEKNIKELIYKTLESEKYFSTQELRILLKYANNDDITTHEIALAFRISDNTINIYNRRIIEKFRDIYAQEKIKTAKEIAQFLRKENFI